MVNQDESRDIYFVTDMKRESVILAATTEALLHQSILDQIESKKYGMMVGIDYSELLKAN